MADVEHKVKTIFEAATGQMSGAMSSLSKQASGLGSMLTGVGGMATAAFAAIGGGVAIGAALKGIAEIHSEFEQTRIVMAGFMETLGLAADHGEALKVAATTMDQIRISAALLPGEAEDYIAIFKAGLPSIAGAIGGSMTQMTAFSNQFAAVTQAMQIPTEQAARDFQKLLQVGKGAAGSHVKSFQRLLPFMQKLPGMADLNTQKFNAMTQSARGALLQQTLQQSGLQNMLKDSAETWDAQTGAIVSNSKALLRIGTEPLFEGMKQALMYMNSALYNADGTMTEFSKTLTAAGQVASTYLVEGFTKAWTAAKGLYSTVGSMLEEMSHNEGINNIIDGISGAMKGGSAGAGALGMVGGLAAGAGPVGLVIGPLISAFSAPGFVDKLLAPLVTQFNAMSTLVGPVLGFFESFSVLGGQLIVSVLPPLLGALTAIMGPVITLAGGIFNLGSYILDSAMPYLTLLFNSVGELAASVGDFLEPILRIIGGVLLWLGEQIAAFLMPAINGLIDGVQQLIHYLAEAIKWLGNKIGLAADALFPKAGPAGSEKTVSIFDGIKKAIEDMKNKNAAAESANKAAERKAPDARGGSKVTQDFRNSRFDITQKFAEGYDPDRIGVAFASDVGKIGEQKLQSGFEPLFGVH